MDTKNIKFKILKKKLNLYRPIAGENVFLYRDYEPGRFEHYVRRQILPDIENIEKEVKKSTDFFSKNPRNLNIYRNFEHMKELKSKMYPLIEKQKTIQIALEYDYKSPIQADIRSGYKAPNESEDIIGSWSRSESISSIPNPPIEDSIITVHREIVFNLENFDQVLDVSIEILKQIMC